MWVSFVPYPFQGVGISGTRSILGVGMSGEGGYVPSGWACVGGGYVQGDCLSFHHQPTRKNMFDKVHVNTFDC